MTVSLDWHWIFFCPTVLQIKCESSNNYSFSKINLILYFQEIKNIDWESYISLKKNRLLALCYATNCALGELPLRVMHISVTILSEYPQLSVNTSSWKLKPTSHAMCMMSGHCKASDNWLKVSLFIEIVVMQTSPWITAERNEHHTCFALTRVTDKLKSQPAESMP